MLFGKRSKMAEKEAGKEKITIDTDCEDLIVKFYFNNTNIDTLTKKFYSTAYFDPSIANYYRGIFRVNAEKVFQKFMNQWAEDGWAIIDLYAVKYSDFDRAVITRIPVTISCPGLKYED